MKKLICLCLILSACANERTPEPRTYAEAINATTTTARASLLLANGEAAPACDTLEAFAASAPAPTGAGFSVFGKIRASEFGWVGGVNVNESPFTQMVLGEKFTLDSEEEFMKKARQEYEAGRIGGFKWMMVRMFKGVGLLRPMAQIGATNGKLEETFPGIFGLMKPLAGSLPLSLVERAVNLQAVGDTEAARLLGLRLPLFPGQGWEAAADSMRSGLGSAVGALRNGTDARERLCAYVLLQHHFGQLLRLKGYRAPVTGAPQPARQLPWVPELSSSQTAFATRELPGAFLNDGKPAVLAAEGITAYDPARANWAVTAVPPGQVGAEKAGGLTESLAMMEGLVYGFEATSPASPWVEEQGYWLGDVQNSSRAFLPAEAHSLALGLLTVHFKNLSARYIKKVARSGALASAEAPAAGLVVDADGAGASVVRVKLAQALRLSLVAAGLEAALGRLAKGRDWAELNPVYQPATLQALLEGDSSLLGSLRSLRLPLAVLLVEMGRQGCQAELEWNLATGARRSIRGCTAGERARLVQQLRQLAAESGSALLESKANEIEKAGA